MRFHNQLLFGHIMKRILINATHNEEIRVALCKGNHLYDFDLENRTREQKKSNIYKAHVTRVEPSLEAVFVEYGAERQGFLPVREIASEYFKGKNPRDVNIRELIKEGDTLIVQVEKEERGNKGAALSTYVSLAGRYLVLMPNNPRGGGISRQISGKQRDDMKRMLANLDMPKGMSVIVRTAGIGKTQEDLQHDLNHLLNIWAAIGEQDRNFASPRLVHQEAGVVTRAVRDYLRDDISEVWMDSEVAYNEAANFISAVMPKQMGKLRKYTDYEPMFARFGIEKQIETAYLREVRLPSGGSIVIDQTEAMVSIDINSAKSTKGSDVAETAYHTNLEAADEIARQLRLRDMGGLVVIDFIDMYENQHQKDVEKRLVDATKYDRARVQFGEISKFGLMEMSRQRLRPSLEESTGYICPRCHGNGMIRDLRSLSLSIMRKIEQIALKERQGEIQAEVPTDIAAFLLNEKRGSLVYLEQDSGTRITILPHAHMESPHFNLNYNRDGFAPSSYDRISDTIEQENSDRGYEVNWQTAEVDRPAQQPTRKPRKGQKGNKQYNNNQNQTATQKSDSTNQPQAVAWLSNLFMPSPQAKAADSLSSQDAAQAIEAIVNNGGQSMGAMGQVNVDLLQNQQPSQKDNDEDGGKRKRKPRKDKYKSRKKDRRYDNESGSNVDDKNNESSSDYKTERDNSKQKRKANSRRDSRGEYPRGETLVNDGTQNSAPTTAENNKNVDSERENTSKAYKDNRRNKHKKDNRRNEQANTNEVAMQVTPQEKPEKEQKVVHMSLDKSKPISSPFATNKSKSGNKAANKPTNKNKEVNGNTTSPETEELATIAAVKTAMAINPQPDVVQQTVETSSVDNTSGNEPEEVNDKVNTLLFADVFTNRYVTAQKYGQASNDPRVVRSNLLNPNQANTTSDVAGGNKKVSGLTGDFIRANIDDAANRLETDGVIACFIEAVKNFNNQTETSIAKTDTSATELADFNFSNYGYEPLSEEYITGFKTMTTSAGQFDAAQGKTDVSPSPIGKRATNDPRGQHPDYVEVEAPSQLAPIEEATVVEPDAKETKAKEVQQEQTEANTEEAKPTVVDSKPDAFDKAFGRMLDAQESENDSSEATNTETSEVEIQTPTKEEIVDEADNDEVDESGKGKEKTTFDKYKNMLANVSEQLTSQSGTNSLFLSTPTIPKKRTRKTKKDDK